MAAGLAGLSVLLAVQAARPPAAPTAPLVVASRDVPAGAALGDDDVRTVSVPVDARPPNGLGAPADAVGRVVAGPVAAGEALTPTRFVGAGSPTGLAGGSGAGADAAAGQVAAPVRIADAGAVALLAPGAVVDVIAARTDATGGARAAVVAAGARVLAVPRRGDGSGGLLASGTGSGAEGALVVLAVGPGTAVELARAAAGGRLSVALRPDPAATP